LWFLKQGMAHRIDCSDQGSFEDVRAEGTRISTCTFCCCREVFLHVAEQVAFKFHDPTAQAILQLQGQNPREELWLA
jgi:hypothetical protein